MSRGLVRCALFALMLATGLAQAEEADREQAAVRAAESWLALVDQGDYAASWSQAAAYFRNAVTQAQWEQALQSVRTPLGALVERELESAKYTLTLPGAPDGEYVVLQFRTVFAHKAVAVETVTPMREANGEWRVSGYFIK